MRPFSTMMLGAGGRILLPATTFGILDLSDAGELGADMEAPLCWIRFLTIPQGGDKTSVGCAPGAIREILAVPCNLPAGSSFLFKIKTKINFNILTLKVVSHSCCSLATITCARQQLRPKLGDDRFALLRSKSRAEKKKEKKFVVSIWRPDKRMANDPSPHRTIWGSFIDGSGGGGPVGQVSLCD